MIPSIRRGAEGIGGFEFEQLCTELSHAAARLSDEQILDLSDTLHDVLRARRVLRAHGGERSFAPVRQATVIP